MLVALRPLLSLVLVTWLGIASVGGVVFGTLVYFPRAWLTAVGWDSWGVALILVVSFFWMWQPIMLVLGVLLKWLLVGKRRPGVRACRYPLFEAACSTYHSILSDVLNHATPYILQPPFLTSLYLRVCGAEIGRRVIIRDPVRRVVHADLLRVGDASLLCPSTLTLQLPVRDEAASKALYKVQSSSFDLGKARPFDSSVRYSTACPRTHLYSHPPCSRRQSLLPGPFSRPRSVTRRWLSRMLVYQAAQGRSPATLSIWACLQQQSSGLQRVA